MRTNRFTSGLRTGMTPVLTLSLLCLSAFLTVSHVRTIALVRDVSVPLLAQVPALERDLGVVREQAELAELHASMRSNTLEEQVRVYVLPEDVDLDRLLVAFELLRDALQKQGRLSGELTVSAGEKHRLEPRELETQRISMRGSLSEDGLRSLIAFVRLSGIVTVGDAIGDSERKMLLMQMEGENPTNVIVLEQFLATSLLAYARAPHLFEERILESFSSDGFHQALRSAARSVLLREANDLLGGDFGAVLERNDLWPLPFLSLQGAEIERGGAPGWSRLRLEVFAYTRN